MAAPLFYNQGDQAIYNSGMSFVPQEKYRLGYTAPTTTPTAAPVSGGITNTNAFTNSGGGFNQSGNAFGYGSPVEEVNVRTFNPQSNDPTGSVANAQTMYNKASNAGPMVETFTGMRPSESVMDYYGGQIMDNREQYGAQGQYNSPYDDTVDLGFRGRDTSTSIQRNRGTIGRAIDFVTDFIPGVGAVKRGAKFIGGLLPDNPNGPGGGSYGIAGLSDAQKEAYNSLAAAGGLFEGPGGMKTLTGKNFNLSKKGFANYMDKQKDIYNDLTGKGFSVNEKGEVVDEDGKVVTGYTKLAMLESSALHKDKIEAADKAYKEKLEADAKEMAANTKNPDGSTAAYNYAGRDNDQGTHTSTISNKQAQTNQESYRGKDGGRVKYFFGGRVNFKDGGLASIL